MTLYKVGTQVSCYMESLPGSPFPDTSIDCRRTTVQGVQVVPHVVSGIRKSRRDSAIELRRLRNLDPVITGYTLRRFFVKNESRGVVGSTLKASGRDIRIQERWIRRKEAEKEDVLTVRTQYQTPRDVYEGKGKSQQGVPITEVIQRMSRLMQNRIRKDFLSGLLLKVLSCLTCLE